MPVQVVEDERVKQIIEEFWDNASNFQKRKVKKDGNYSYYQTIRTAIERGRFSERMIKAFLKNIDSEELVKIINNNYGIKI